MLNNTFMNKIASYVPADWDGTDRSEIELSGDEVLVIPDIVPKMTKGGLYIPDETRDLSGNANMTGVIVQIGPDAFTRNRTRTGAYVGPRYEIGDRVLFAKYAGDRVWGMDSGEYQLMTDSGVVARYRRRAAEAVTEAAASKPILFVTGKEVSNV